MDRLNTKSNFVEQAMLKVYRWYSQLVLAVSATSRSKAIAQHLETRMNRLDNTHTLKAPARHQSGAALLEVMLAGILFMVGMLGLLATQGLAMKLANTSSLHTNAAILVADLSDRMKANHAGAIAGDYVINLTTGAAPAGLVDCASSDVTCTPAQLAIYDLSQWQNTIKNQKCRYEQFCCCMFFGS